MSRYDQGSRAREMHEAVCSDCGKETTVPFEPTEGRPVYCRDCFQKHRPPRSGGDRRGGQRGGQRGGRSGGQREMHEVVCDDCGKETTVPFKPSGNRPVYCRDCFQKHR